jgi:hypothetical protein
MGLKHETSIPGNHYPDQQQDITKSNQLQGLIQSVEPYAQGSCQ